MGIAFDEDHVLYPFTSIAICLFIILPTFWRLIKHQWNHWGIAECNYKQCRNKKYYHLKRKVLNSFFLLHLIVISTGCYALYLTTQQISTVPYGTVEIWDPLKVLGITHFTSAIQIKKVFKKKSVRLHPDKRRKGISKEDAEAQFILLTKAYKCLTDSNMREMYLESGLPDGIKYLRKTIALPSWLLNDNVGYFILVMYLSFVVGMPCYAVLWYLKDSSKSKTLQGVSVSTAERFLKAATAKEQSKLNVRSLIRLLSGCDEITKIIQSNTLYASDILQVYTSLPIEEKYWILTTKMDTIIAEMLVYSHLYQLSLPPKVDNMRERVIPLYVHLSQQFFPFLFKTGRGTQYKQIIYLIRQLKQATLNHTRDEDAHSTPSNRLYVTNIHIRVPGEEQITPDSKMRLSFHAHLLHDIDDNMFLDDLDLSDSDSEDDDLNILLQRKKRKNAGDKSPLPPAHLPYYPEYTKPAWYAFISKDDKVISMPRLITDIPYVNSHLKPRQFRMQIIAPKEGKHTLQLHLISDTYFDSDLKYDIELKVVATQEEEPTEVELQILEKLKGKFPPELSRAQALKKLRRFIRSGAADRLLKPKMTSTSRNSQPATSAHLARQRSKLGTLEDAAEEFAKSTGKVRGGCTAVGPARQGRGGDETSPSEAETRSDE